jgi:hypothetical protein
MSSCFAISPLALHPGHYFVCPETPVFPKAISRQAIYRAFSGVPYTQETGTFRSLAISCTVKSSVWFSSPSFITVAPFIQSLFGLRIRVVPNRLWNSSFPNLDADKTLCAVTAQLGWSDPTNHFGHGNVHKSGVAPAQSGVLSAPKLIVATCITSLASDSSGNPRVN